MFRRDTGIDRDHPHFGGEILVGQCVEHLPRDDAILRTGDVEFRGDRQRGLGVIAGDHDGTNAGHLTLQNGITHILAWRVDHADKPGEG